MEIIKKVDNVLDANRCDELLTKLVQDERKYNDTIVENLVVKDHFNKMLDDDKVCILAYYIDNLIVGYILVRIFEDKTCLLDGLFVEEEYRNRKIGSSLINKALEYIKDKDIKYIDINVMKENEVARHLYKKLGFNDFEIKMRKNI